MIFLRYTWDHIEVEDFSNYLTPLETELPFSMTHMGNWVEGPGYYVKRQNPDDYYLLYTVSGCGSVTYRQNTVSLQPGYICLIDGGEMHSYKTEGSTPWHSIWFHLSGKGMAGYFSIMNPGGSFRPVFFSDSDMVLDLYRQLKQNLSYDDIVKALENCSVIVTFLNKILKESVSVVESSGTSESVLAQKQLHEIKCYIEDKTHTIITASQICNHFHLPLHHINLLFLRYERISLTEYIQKRYSIYRTPDNMGISVDHPEWLMEAITYLDENFTLDIKMKDLIAKYHVSKPFFIYKFKQYTCMAPLEYLIQLRLEHALILLEKTDKKISAIASESGFPSASNFTARFKEWTGVLPAVYRRNRLV